MQIHYLCSAFKKAYHIDDLDFIESENSLVLFSKEKRMIFEFHYQPNKMDLTRCIDAWLYHRFYVERVKKNSEHASEVQKILKKCNTVE